MTDHIKRIGRVRDSGGSVDSEIPKISERNI